MSALDPLVARDGRPFGAGQGNRMRVMAWPLPSVFAGSFRSALVKSNEGLDFTGDRPRELAGIEVAGAFPTSNGMLYFPAPIDAVAEPRSDGKGIERTHRVIPRETRGGCDAPEDGLKPVSLSDSQSAEDFKPAEVPAWWPLDRYVDWLSGREVTFDSGFLRSAVQETRDHASLDAERGAVAEGSIFRTGGLNAAYLPRFADGIRVSESESGSRSFRDRYAEVTLSIRVSRSESESGLEWNAGGRRWHPLGGERRLAHWESSGDSESIRGWTCPEEIESALGATRRVRMILASPAIFEHGWKPGWLTNGLEGELGGVKLRLTGVANGRWKAVSGWSLAPPRGPKAIRRMVPAGSVYFFEVEKEGAAAGLSRYWLESVSDGEQERRDGFGLAVWGIW